MSEPITVAMQPIEPDSLLAARYRIERQIGSGGSACVYLAHDIARNQPVAVKVLHSAYASDRSYVDRFIREAQLMRRVDHPNVVRTHDISFCDGRLFFTMDYVVGYNLRDLIDAGGADLIALKRIVNGICNALDAIHEKEIIHRDLKPSNILVDAHGRIRITDFGIARPADSKMTGIKERLGCLEYMAPEMLQGDEITTAVDFYAFGVVLYELCTGEQPFQHKDMMKLVDMHMKGRYRSIRSINKELPEWLERLVDSLLEREPTNRLTSTKEIRRYFPNDFEGQNRFVNPSVLVRDEAYQREASKKNTERIYRISATKVLRTDQFKSAKPTATIQINLPKDAAVIFELEPPSRDVIYFGVFLASLQVLDGVLTSTGMERFGTRAEGNPMLRMVMEHFTPDQALFMVKATAILVVVFLTILAKRSKFVKDLIGVLSCIYLLTAIVPWVYVLWLR